MKVIIYIAIILFLTPTTLLASQVKDAKKCVAISDPNERLKCFDNIFTKTALKTTKNIKASGMLEVNAVMEEILKIPLQKDELETTKEFHERILKLYKKYDGKVYDLVLDIKTHNTDRRKLAKYNPDNKMLTISMPSLDFVSIRLQIKDKADGDLITMSFLETKSLEQDISKYTARNRLGNEVEVIKAVFRDIGLAILGKSNRDMNPQSFTVQVSRDKIRSILQNGKVKITVRTDLIKKGSNSFLLDNWMTFMSKGASILISEKDERDPTMTDPRHVVREKAMLPVRILSMHLLDGAGKEIKSVKGSQINTNYFRE